MAIPVVLNNPSYLLPIVGPQPGELWTWGFRDYGATADGTFGPGNKTVPSAIGSHEFVKVAAGLEHYIAIKADNTVWVWGQNASGQHGMGDTTARNTPTQVPGVFFIDIAAGANFSVGLDEDGYPWGAGSNNAGQLGNLIGGSTTSFQQISLTQQFESIDAGSDSTSFTFHATYALNTAGEIWGWGDSSQSQTAGSTPTKLSTGSDVYTFICATGLNCSAIKSDGTLWGRGYNGNGDLGVGDTSNKSTFTQVVGVGHTYSKVARGYRCGVGIRSDVGNEGKIMGWGTQNSGILGALAGINHTPTEIFAGPYEDIATNKNIYLSNARITALVLDASGNLYGWGDNSSSQIPGAGDPTTSPTVIASGTAFDRLPKSLVTYTPSAIRVV